MVSVWSPAEPWLASWTYPYTADGSDGSDGSDGFYGIACFDVEGVGYVKTEIVNIWV